eukprot:351733-Chlamydomonas_euryale.AAC.2
MLAWPPMGRPLPPLAPAASAGLAAAGVRSVEADKTAVVIGGEGAAASAGRADAAEARGVRTADADKPAALTAGTGAAASANRADVAAGAGMHPAKAAATAAALIVGLGVHSAEAAKPAAPAAGRGVGSAPADMSVAAWTEGTCTVGAGTATPADGLRSTSPRRAAVAPALALALAESLAATPRPPSSGNSTAAGPPRRRAPPPPPLRPPLPLSPPGASPDLPFKIPRSSCSCQPLVSAARASLVLVPADPPMGPPAELLAASCANGSSVVAPPVLPAT